MCDPASASVAACCLCCVALAGVMLFAGRAVVRTVSGAELPSNLPFGGGCHVANRSLGKCERCLLSEQCEEGRFCCPYMKKCVASSTEACSTPIASCVPGCRGGDLRRCHCENPDFPDTWVDCAEGPSSAGFWSSLVGGDGEPQKIHSAKASAYKSYCYGYYGTFSWCWLAGSSGEYAKDGEPTACGEYDGELASERCYRDEGSNGGESFPAPTAKPSPSPSPQPDGSSPSPPPQPEGSGVWKCPAGGHWYVSKFGSPTDSEAKDWTMAHNVFRCMHDVQFVQWSNPVADDIKAYLAPLQSMAHSDSYSLAPPAGPAGENLFQGWGAAFPVGSGVQSWYSEIKDPGCDSFPGCGGQFSMGTGHLTAMIWAGVQKIGCSSNEHGVKGCRYKAGDSLSCDTPNMQGCFDKQVPKASRKFSTCKTQVEECFGDSLGSEVSWTRLDAEFGAPLVPPAVAGAPLGAGFAAVRSIGVQVVASVFLLLALAGLAPLLARRLQHRQAGELPLDAAAEEAPLAECGSYPLQTCSQRGRS